MWYHSVARPERAKRKHNTKGTTMKSSDINRKTRHARYKVGTCKLTVTVENEDKVKLHRKAVRLEKKDDSAYLRELVHEAVWDEPLLPEDYDTLKKMREAQEV